MISKREKLFEQIRTIKGFFYKYCIPIVIITILLTVVGTIYSLTGVNKVYYSSARIYVRHYTEEQGYLSEGFLVSQDLTEDAVQIIQSIPVLEKAIFNCKLQNLYSASSLQKQMYAYTDYQSRIVNIIMAETDPERAQTLTNAVCNAAIDQINHVMNGDWAVVIDSASLPDAPEYPVVWETAIQSTAFALGVAFLLAVIYSMRDYRIRSAEDVKKYLGLSLLGSIPKESGKQKRLKLK